MKKIFLCVIVIMSTVLSINCGNTTVEKAEEHEETKLFVEVTEAQMDVSGIKLGKLAKRNLRTAVKANGVLELPPENRATISTLLGGSVKSILVREGDFVKENQTLALIEHPQFIEIQQEYIETVNNYNYLEQDYTRKKKLYDENVSSGKEFQQVQAEFNSVKARVNALKAKIQLLNLPAEEIESGKIYSSIPVRAPIHGYIKNISVNLGSFAEPEKKMFEIVDNHHIHIDLLVYESDINKIKKGQKVIFQVANSGNKELVAKVFAVGKSFEDDLKAIRIHAEIENQNNDLIPGMYVNGKIIVDDFETMTLPETAIIRESENAFIFVKTNQKEDNHEAEDGHEHDEAENSVNESERLSFKKVQIKTGATENGYTEILFTSGVDEYEQIAVEGAYYLESELNKGDGEHHH